jgi:hypothetical protein
MTMSMENQWPVKFPPASSGGLFARFGRRLVEVNVVEGQIRFRLRHSRDDSAGNQNNRATRGRNGQLHE